MRIYVAVNIKDSQDYKKLSSILENHLITELITMGRTPLERLAEYYARMHSIEWKRVEDNGIIYNCNGAIIIDKEGPKATKLDEVKLVKEANRKLWLYDWKSGEVFHTFKN